MLSLETPYLNGEPDLVSQNHPPETLETALHKQGIKKDYLFPRDHPVAALYPSFFIEFPREHGKPVFPLAATLARACASRFHVRARCLVLAVLLISGGTA